MVEHELVTPFVRLEGTMQSVLGLSPALVSNLWDTMAPKSQGPCKRRLESEYDSESISKFKSTNASDYLSVIEDHVIDDGNIDSDGGGYAYSDNDGADDIDDHSGNADAR